MYIFRWMRLEKWCGCSPFITSHHRFLSLLSLLFHLPDLYKVYFIISWIRIRIPVYLRAGAGSYKNAIRINNIITSFIHKKKFCWTVTQFFETSPVFDILKKIGKNKSYITEFLSVIRNEKENNFNQKYKRLQLLFSLHKYHGLAML